MRNNENCDACPQVTQANNYFLVTPIVEQLKIFYRRAGFTNKLQHRNNRRKTNMQNLEDIYDGQMYQDLSKPPGILSDDRNISFMWNTDGLSLYKSSKFQVWPFYLVINELPYNERYRKENLLMAGLWFGQRKPFPSLFLHTISDELVQLRYGMGFRITKR